MYTSFQNKIEMSSPNVVQCELFDIVIELTVTYCLLRHSNSRRPKMDIDSLIFNSENFRHSCGGAHLLYGKSFAENCRNWTEIKEIGLNGWGVPSTDLSPWIHQC